MVRALLCVPCCTATAVEIEYSSRSKTSASATIKISLPGQAHVKITRGSE